MEEVERLKRRLKAWRAEVGTRSEFAEFAPRIVKQLEDEIAYLSDPARADDVIPLSAYERGILLKLPTA